MKRKVIKTIYRKLDEQSAVPMCYAFYNKSYGDSQISIEAIERRSDTFDSAEIFLVENGVKKKIREHSATKQIPQGTVRDYTSVNLVYPTGIRKGVKTEQLINFKLKGLFPTDNPIEGMTNWSVWYTLSSDGGVTINCDKQVIQKGIEYNPMEPMKGIKIGKNCIMLGDLTVLPIILDKQKNKKQNGKILLGVQLSLLDENEVYYNPNKARSYTQVAAIMGDWNDDGELEWEISDVIKCHPDDSERGLIEPAITELKDGRILMIMRANKTIKGEGGYKWYAISEDGGYAWSEPVPWTYENGENFYSPSACSELLRHSNGKIYWIGNICPEQPGSNGPRYPLIIGEVEEENGLLLKDTISTIATREKGQSDEVTYSNFYAYEDRKTGNIKMHLSPFHIVKGKPYDDSASYLYEIEIKE